MRKGRSMLVCVGRAASAPKKHLVYAVRACKLGPRFVVMEPRCACAIGEFYLRRAKLAKNVDFWRLRKRSWMGRARSIALFVGLQDRWQVEHASPIRQEGFMKAATPPRRTRGLP